MQVLLNASVKRVHSALIGVPLLLAMLLQADFQSFGFYAEHYTIPMEKFGVRTPLRWQDIVFLVVFWSIAPALFYISYRLLKYAFSPPRVFFRSAVFGMVASIIAGLLAFAAAPFFDAVGVYIAPSEMLIPVMGRAVPSALLISASGPAAGVGLALGCALLFWTIVFGIFDFAWVTLRADSTIPPLAKPNS